MPQDVLTHEDISKKIEIPLLGDIQREIHQTVYFDSSIREDGKRFGILEKSGKFKVSLSEPKFSRVNSKDLAFIASSAGLGHKTPLLGAIHAVRENIMRAYTGVISDDVHAVGSSGWEEKIVKKVCENKKAQRRWERVHLFTIMADTSMVENDVREILLNCKKDTVLLVFTHHDSLIALSSMKKDLEKEYGKTIRTALILCDHFLKYDQYNWERLEADMILTPDKLTADLMEKRIQERADYFMGEARGDYRLPVVLNVGGFSVEIGLKDKLSQEEFEMRKTRLSSDLSSSPRVLVPLGGALPQKDLIVELTEMLKVQDGYKNVNITTLLHKKNDPDYDKYVETMKSFQVEVIEGEKTDEVIDLTHQYLAGMHGMQDILLTKPSEKVNIAQFSPDKAGGAICAFLPPVGSQEEENLRFLRSGAGGNVLLSELQQKRLIKFLHKIDGKENLTARESKKLIEWQEKAKELRGVALPEDAQEAAFILYACKKFGILAAMMEFRPKADTDMSEDGAIKIFEAMEDGLKQIEESPDRDKPLFVHEVPKVKIPEGKVKSFIAYLKIMLKEDPHDKWYEALTPENFYVMAKYFGYYQLFFRLQEKWLKSEARKMLRNDFADRSR